MKLDLSELKSSLEGYKDSLREQLLVYTRKAFHTLPALPSPEILDIGCGSGIPALELARLSNGNITGIDIDQNKLNELAKKAAAAGLSGRITTLNQSLLNMDFPSSRFDIIWAEGSISVIGFDRGLLEWKTFIKNGGFLVVHDEKGILNKKIKAIPRIGYELIDHFIINQKVWWNKYFAPLDKYIEATLKKYSGHTRVNLILQNDRREIDEFQIKPERYQSVFFIMRKT
jgi:ubiquinone/menaquinone biosynthesis C-methylase UbiE